MLLKANKYRKDKKADCRQNELGSRIFVEGFSSIMRNICIFIRVFPMDEL